jgi:uncharacterized repeat protein (TIGR01451 family)
VTTVTPLANLSVVKSAAPSPVVVTSNLVYSLLVSNLGPTDATGVTVTDSLPPNTVYISAQSSQGFCTTAGGIVTCNFDTLTNGGSATISVVVGTMIEGNLTNTATVSAGTADPVAGNNTSTALVVVTNHPGGPILRTVRSGTNLVLSWTTNSAGYQLQSLAGDLAGGAWQQVTNAPVVRGTQFFVTNAINSSVPSFYRLSKTVGRPALSAARPGTRAMLSPSTSLGGFVLEAAPPLIPSSPWVPITKSPVAQTDRFDMLDGAANPATFHRVFPSG